MRNSKTLALGLAITLIGVSTGVSAKGGGVGHVPSVTTGSSNTSWQSKDPAFDRERPKPKVHVMANGIQIHTGSCVHHMGGNAGGNGGPSVTGRMPDPIHSGAADHPHPAPRAC
jgi:hypothetical protein